MWKVFNTRREMAASSMTNKTSKSGKKNSNSSSSGNVKRKRSKKKNVHKVISFWFDVLVLCSSLREFWLSFQIADFSLLDMPALKKYKKHYKIRTKHNCPKAEVVTAIQKHFATLQVDPQETIMTFVQKNRRIDDGKRLKWRLFWASVTALL